jgi:hypothetical protein
VRRPQWLLPLSLLLPLLSWLLLSLLCLLLLLILDFHLDIPLLLLEFLLTLIFLSKEIHLLPLLRLPRLEITPHLFISIPLVELLHLLDLLLADHVPVVAETVMGSLVSIPEWFPHFKF